jgi:hypothetical protein
MMKKLVTVFVACTFALCLASCNSTNGKTATGEAVLVMDHDIVSSDLKEVSSDGTLVFTNLKPEEIPAKGAVICSAPSKLAPQGFLYKVKEVTTKGDETTIVTEMATIEESIKNASVSQSFNLSVATIENVPGVDVQIEDYAANSAKSAVQYAGLFDFLWGDGNSSMPDTKLALAKLNVDIPFGDKGSGNAVGIKGRLKGSIDISTMFHCEMDIEDYSLKHLSLTTNPQFKAQLATAIEGRMTQELKVHIATFQYAPVTVMAGSIPVVFTPVLAIDAVITVNGEVSMQATLVDWDYSYTFGCTYNGNEWTTISENVSQPPKYLENIQLSLNGSVKVQPQLSYQYELYNTGTTAGVSGNLYAKLENNIGSEKKLSFHCGLEFGTEGELKIFSKQIGSWKLTFCSLDWLIWEKLLETPNQSEYNFCEDVTIQGVLERNYYEVLVNDYCDGNIFEIEFAKPINIIATEKSKESDLWGIGNVSNETKIQVINPDIDLEKYVNKKVRLKGSFEYGRGGNEGATVVYYFFVKDIEPLDESN